MCHLWFRVICLWNWVPRHWSRGKNRMKGNTSVNPSLKEKNLNALQKFCLTIWQLKYWRSLFLWNYWKCQEGFLFGRNMINSKLDCWLPPLVRTGPPDEPSYRRKFTINRNHLARSVYAYKVWIALMVFPSKDEGSLFHFKLSVWLHCSDFW